MADVSTQAHSACTGTHLHNLGVEQKQGGIVHQPTNPAHPPMQGTYVWLSPSPIPFSHGQPLHAPYCQSEPLGLLSGAQTECLFCPFCFSQWKGLL